ncbi:unnamed protein product [Medioppia subpectinata]|uniref:Protein kinase domain-containing protein n=1 Tax=Medioppia subpectinata TaxID=1979941 RepID=A0A7R9PYN0_9ACAR|nr:unnamed protein product [Medioppia subpectinata]CAG2106088.1 unnamed protein product [Medioppia subpectinata]
MDCNIETDEGKYKREFECLANMGWGSYGYVVKVRHKLTNDIHAIKIFHKVISDKINESVQNECRCLSQMNSDFVVKFRNAWIEGQILHIQTEFCDYSLQKIISVKNALLDFGWGPEISRQLSLIDYFISYELFDELTKSLNYLHTLNPPIMHRDLNPANTLVLNAVSGHGRQFVKICDFGYAKPHKQKGQSNTINLGTLHYMAPEVGYEKHYDPMSDIYSLGRICCDLFRVDISKSSWSYGKFMLEKYKGWRTLIVTMLTGPNFWDRPTCEKILATTSAWQYKDIFLQECQWLSQIRSDFVVEFRSAWREEYRQYIETEFCDYNMREIIDIKNCLFSQPSVDDTSAVYALALIDYFIAYELFEELTRSLNYLHTLDIPIIHRNLTPESILVINTVFNSGGQYVKLSNFGYAKLHIFNGQPHTIDERVINYMAPEVAHSKYYDLKSDIYSLGLICCELFDVSPFSFKNKINEKSASLKEKYLQLEEPISDMLNSPMYDLRPTCTQILSRMRAWRLSLDEMLTIREMLDQISNIIVTYSENEFFHNFLVTKLSARIDESTVQQSVESDIPTLAAPDPSINDSPFIDYNVLNAIEGDIIEIVVNGERCSTIWGVYVGGDQVVYVCPESHCLLNQSLETLCCDDSERCRVNNLVEVSESRQLSRRPTDSILCDAFRATIKYSRNLPTDSRGHNVGIHFVTKCRFGHQFCEECVGQEMVEII